LFVKLNRAIKELTEKQELTIQKIFYEGMNNSELAREEGISETAIRHRLIKIYANLRKKIC
jgi:DNA-directed RNA polymerase specialized sigma24 family protein